MRRTEMVFFEKSSVSRNRFGQDTDARKRVEHWDSVNGSVTSRKNLCAGELAGGEDRFTCS